jgi:hypothetical protein
MLHRFRDKNFYLVFTTDAFLLCCAYYASYWVRFDGNIPPIQMTTFSDSIIVDPIFRTII